MCNISREIQIIRIKNECYQKHCNRNGKCLQKLISDWTCLRKKTTKPEHMSIGTLKYESKENKDGKRT